MKRTLDAVGINHVFALLVGVNATLGASQTLPHQSPQQTSALAAERGRRGGQHDEVVRSRT